MKHQYLLRFAGVILVSGLIGFATFHLDSRMRFKGIDGSNVRATKVVADTDITKQIENIQAPFLNAFGPALFIDGGDKDVHAWHAPINPQYPIVVDVQFKQSVLLKRIGFQAQYGGGDIFLRAPKAVRVSGGPDFMHLKELGMLSFKFTAGGSWSFGDLPETKLKTLCYRLEILNNQGNPQYVTVQESKFYGQI